MCAFKIPEFSQLSFPDVQFLFLFLFPRQQTLTTRLFVKAAVNLDASTFHLKPGPASCHSTIFTHIYIFKYLMRSSSSGNISPFFTLNYFAFRAFFHHLFKSTLVKCFHWCPFPAAPPTCQPVRLSPCPWLLLYKSSPRTWPAAASPWTGPCSPAVPHLRQRGARCDKTTGRRGRDKR